MGGGVLQTEPDITSMKYNDDGTFNFTNSGIANESGITENISLQVIRSH